MATSVTCSTGTTPLTSKRDITKELEQMFKTKTKVNRLFVVDGAKIGVIFNPERQRVNFGVELCIDNKVILVYEPNTPDKVVQKIKKAIPQKHSNSLTDVSHNKIDGKSLFQFINWE